MFISFNINNKNTPNIVPPYIFIGDTKQLNENINCELIILINFLDFYSSLYKLRFIISTGHLGVLYSKNTFWSLRTVNEALVHTNHFFLKHNYSNLTKWNSFQACIVYTGSK